MLRCLNELAVYTVFTKIHFVSGFPRNKNRKTGVYREIIPRGKFEETDFKGKHITASGVAPS